MGFRGCGLAIRSQIWGAGFRCERASCEMRPRLRDIRPAGIHSLYGDPDSGFWWSMTPVLTRLVPLLFGLAPLLAACGEGAPKQAAPAPPTVTVAKPTRQTVTDYDEYVGRFIAVDSVEIRARVSGYLDKVHFKDGQIVKQGDPLFTIDRRPFET